MAEVKTYVQTARVEFECETAECAGKVLYMGVVVPGTPMKFKHKCPICTEMVDLEKQYPAVEYEDV